MKLSWTLLFMSSAFALPAKRSDIPAPYNVPDSEYLVPDGYIVRFHANHTLEEHFINIGFDVRQFAVSFMEMPHSNAYLFSTSAGNSSSLHDYIRHDPGVLRVDHDEYIHGEQMGEVSEHPPNAPPKRLRGKGLLRRWQNVERTSDYWNNVMITLGKTFNFGRDVGGTWKSYRMTSAGSGVDVYVFDSGIKIEHDYFRDGEGRIASHFQGLKSTDRSPYCGTGGTAGVTMVSACPYMLVYRLHIHGSKFTANILLFIGRRTRSRHARRWYHLQQ